MTGFAKGLERERKHQSEYRKKNSGWGEEGEFWVGELEELTLGPKAGSRGPQMTEEQKGAGPGGSPPPPHPLRMQGLGGVGPGTRSLGSGAPSPGPCSLTVAPHFQGERRKWNPAPRALLLPSVSHEGQEGKRCLLRQGMMNYLSFT